MIAPFMIVIAYLLGSIPFGLIVTQMAGAGDVREIGSGNIGATNVLRTGRKELALLTLLLDMLKGTLAVLLAVLYAPDIQVYAAAAALLGHMFPIWLKFKGGKGVATALGVFIALSPPVALMAMLVWLASAIILRISSASALVAVGTMPVFIRIFQENTLMPLAFVVIALVFFKHKDNISRLMEGTEPHIGHDKKDKAEDETQEP